MPASKSLEELRKEKEALAKLHKEQLERAKLLVEIAELHKKTRKRGLVEKTALRLINAWRSDD